MYQTIVEAIFANGSGIPDHLAVGFKKTRLTYGEICGQIRNCAALLSEVYGIKDRDRVMLSALSKPEYAVILFGIQYLGAITVPLDRNTKEDGIRRLYDFVQPKILITDASIKSRDINIVSMKALYAKIRQGGCLEPPAYITPDGNAVAELIFTTGTTGKPKGIMLTYDNILAITENNRDGVNMQPDDVILLPLPMFHSVGLRVMRTALYIGAAVVFQNGFTFAKDIETNIEEFGCTALVTVPASLELVCRQMQEHFTRIMSKLRYMEVGSGSLGYDMKKKLIKQLPDTNIYNVWGSSETGGAIFLDMTHRPDKLASMGKPLDTVKIKIIGSDGQEVAAEDIDTAGRLALQGEMQTVGYYHMPETTAQALVDGWLLTNDLVYTDEEGFVYMVGRTDDIINVGGEKVSPLEVENVAQECYSIRQCACIGVNDPDGILGSIPILYVVPEGIAFNEQEVSRFLSTKLEKYKLPHKYLIIDELPYNRLQKLDRKALYALWEHNGDCECVNDIIMSIRSRRSIREFTEQPIPQNVLDAIVQTGIYAPSGHNMQTWRFSVLQKQEQILKLKTTIDKVAAENNVHFYGFNNPSAVVLVSNDRRNADGIQDSSCAAQNMMLAAHSLGIGSTWVNALMTLGDEPEIRKLLDEFGIPRTHIVWATLVMGYPAQEGKLLAKKKNVINWL